MVVDQVIQPRLGLRMVVQVNVEDKYATGRIACDNSHIGARAEFTAPTKPIVERAFVGNVIFVVTPLDDRALPRLIFAGHLGRNDLNAQLAIHFGIVSRTCKIVIELNIFHYQPLIYV
jgi:hypothetical protein